MSFPNPLSMLRNRAEAQMKIFSIRFVGGRIPGGEGKSEPQIDTGLTLQVVRAGVYTHVAKSSESWRHPEILKHST